MIKLNTLTFNIIMLKTDTEQLRANEMNIH